MGTTSDNSTHAGATAPTTANKFVIAMTTIRRVDITGLQTPSLRALRGSEDRGSMSDTQCARNISNAAPGVGLPFGPRSSLSRADDVLLRG